MTRTGAERKVYLSRKTSFPIFSHDVGDSWLQLLNLVSRIGTEKCVEDGGRVAEALNAMVTVGLPVIAEDLEVEATKPEAFPSFLDLSPRDFERYFETSGLFGTPQSCRPMIRRLREVGVDEVACLVDFGVDQDRVLAHLTHLNELRKHFTEGSESVRSESISVSSKAR